MLIFIIPAIYPHEDNTQLGIYIKEQCKSLKQIYNHKFVILDASSRNYKKWKYCREKKVNSDSVGIIYSKLTKTIAQSKFPRLAIYFYKKNLFELFENAIIKYGKPDLIYAHFSFPSGYCASQISKKYEIPLVVDEHYSMYLNKKIHPYIAEITSRTIESSNSFICVSNLLKQAIERHTATSKSIRVIPNLIDDRYFYKKKIRKNKFIFFSAGNLYKSKNFELLIDSFIKAFSPTDDVQLFIAGDGPEKEFLLSKIREHKRENQIIMLGRIISEKMLEYYEWCDCFALFSEYETFGIVYREALAVGRPIISTKNGGIEENWMSEYGLLIDDGNVDNCVNALIYMRNNISNFDNKKISELCRKRYSASIIANLINNEFLNCI